MVDAFQLSVTPQAVVDNSNDNTTTMTASQSRAAAKPLRSALRSSGERQVATPNDLPSKSAAKSNKSPTTTGRRVEQQQRIETPLPDGLAAAVDGTGGVGTTLSDLKRQRAQTRRSPDSSPASVHSASVGKSTTGGSGVGNGDLSQQSNAEPRLRLTSPEYVSLDQKHERTCCVIF